MSTKFCTDLHTNSGKVLNTNLTLPTRLPHPRALQTPKPKQIIGEKTLLYKKYPDGRLNLIKFFPGSAGPWLAWLVIHKKSNQSQLMILLQNSKSK